MNFQSTVVPNENIATMVTEAMLGEKVLSSVRMTTGDQHFVYAIKTSTSEFVIRMTKRSNKGQFDSAIYWQEKLIPIGVPLAKFIKSDLDGIYSPFPSLLMRRLPGDDLCNLYSSLSVSDKRNIATQMIKIQNTTKMLPNGLGFGITNSYEAVPEFKSWYDFLNQRLHLFSEIIDKNGIFDISNILKVISIAKDMKKIFFSVSPSPFLWDASERNVIIHNGNISGIVDVDEICFGDPLLVIGLTSTALECDYHDTLYTAYWAEGLLLNDESKLRLEFYRLFYVIAFMRKNGIKTTNNNLVMFNSELLNNLLETKIIRIQNMLL